MPLSRICVVATLLLAMISPLSYAATVSTEEMTFLSMYFKEEELQVISATRSLKSITRVAENVTVITADEIQLMNAHTVADVLTTVNGVQVFFAGASPGSIASTFIQGSSSGHVAFFLDGILLNSATENTADPGSLPVQFIDKIEIIQGPASSVWGSSLGGVVNIITKPSGANDGFGGVFSLSYGDEDTGDFRGQLSGRKNGFGFYLTAGRLQTDGLRPYNDFAQRNLYTKLTYDLASKTSLLFTLYYDKGDRTEGADEELDLSFGDTFEDVLSSLSLKSSLTEEIDLNLSLTASRQRIDLLTDVLSTGERIEKKHLDDRKYGGSVRVSWRRGVHSAVVGADYEDASVKSNVFAEELKVRRWAIFANDTITLGRFSLTPGIRYDNSDTFEDFVSPSLGATYQLHDTTILRAFIAHGFNNPTLADVEGDTIFFRHNPDLEPETVWSYQAGIETTVLRYLWLKASAFRHDIRDAIVPEELTEDLFTVVNREKVRRQGFQVELKTIPVYDFTLSAATTHIDTKNLTTDEEIRDVPKYTYDVSLKYDDQRSFRGLLKGRYIWWNASSGLDGKYSSLVFDINLIKSIPLQGARSIELFLNLHNIFDGAQYPMGIYKNAGRWVEGGLRVAF